MVKPGPCTSAELSSGPDQQLPVWSMQHPIPQRLIATSQGTHVSASAPAAELQWVARPGLPMHQHQPIQAPGGQPHTQCLSQPDWVSEWFRAPGGLHTKWGWLTTGLVGCHRGLGPPESSATSRRATGSHLPPRCARRAFAFAQHLLKETAATLAVLAKAGKQDCRSQMPR